MSPYIRNAAPWKGGEIIMPAERWGQVGFNEDRKVWYVKGKWQGQRLYYSTYQSILGHRACQTEQEARDLQLVISTEIEKGVFNPDRYKKAKPHHINKYTLAWLESIKGEISYATWRAYRAATHYIISGLGDVYIRDRFVRGGQQP